MNTNAKRYIKQLESKRGGLRVFDSIVDKATVRDVCIALREALNSKTQEVLCNVLRKKGKHEAIPTLLRVARRTNHPKVRAGAVEALGDLNARSAGKLALRFLRDKKQPVFVRDTSALTLGLIGYKPAESALISNIASPQRTVRYCIAKALGLLKSTKSLPALIDQLQRERSNDVRSVIREAIGEIVR